MQPSIQIYSATSAEPSDPAPVTPNRVPAAGEALSREHSDYAQEENEGRGEKTCAFGKIWSQIPEI